MREQLRRDYLEDRQQRQQRIIDVDVRPLDNYWMRGGVLARLAGGFVERRGAFFWTEL